jgi:dihydrofolate reductase
MITIIAATGENNELGKNNDLVWHLPDDFKRFKSLTTGHHIIMGRKTFESFPSPLPNRTHIVITRDKAYYREGIVVVHSMEEALSISTSDPQPFIIGGGEIYSMGLEFASIIELTKVHSSFEADTFFPKIPPRTWELISEEYHHKDERHRHSFTYQTWLKKG